jgi:hypothetical protein
LKQIRILHKLILAVALLAVGFNTTAQVKISSPYSIYGIGDLYGSGSQMNMALGGAVAAFNSPYFINSANPASYMAFDSNSFVVDASFNLRSGTIKTTEQSQKTRFGTVSNLAFGLPVTHWWATSVGVLPLSQVGFDMQTTQDIPDVGNSVNTYSGNGGLNKAYFGNAFSPFKNFSVGLNVSYIFGNIVKQAALTFPDSATYANTMVKSTASLRKLTYDFGLIYRKDLKEGKYIQLGLTYVPAQELNGSAEKITYTYAYNASNNSEVIKDTINYETSDAKLVRLPTSIGAGVLFGVTNRWFAVAGINWQKWSEFRYLGNDPEMLNNLRISLGAQFRPSVTNMGKYFQRVNYRAGFRYQQGNLVVQDTRINDLGLSFGVGLPMKKSNSTINVALEIGSKGTTANGLIQENYMRLTIGAALQERWFLKRRFN